jgi:hypothetical protein
MLPQLDTAVAFVALMLMLSLLVTAMVQVIAALLDLRGRNLARALASLFEQIDPGLGMLHAETSKARGAWKKLTHPFSRITLATELADAVSTHPILAHTFTRAKAIRKEELVDVVKDLYASQRLSPSVRERLDQFVRPGIPGGVKSIDVAKAVAGKLEAQFPGATVEVCKAFEEALGRVSGFEAGVEKWFDTVMDRASDIFTRWTRTITVVISVLLVVVLHIDAGAILGQLSSSPEIRAGLNKISDSALSQADEVTRRGNRGSAAVEQFLKDRRIAIPDAARSAAPPLATCAEAAVWLVQVASEALPKEMTAARLRDDFGAYCRSKTLGDLEGSEREISAIRAQLAQTELRLVPAGAFGAAGDSYGDRLRVWSSRYTSAPRHLLGTLGMVILLSLGAPFWYNALKQLSNLKPTITQKVEKESAPS